MNDLSIEEMKIADYEAVISLWNRSKGLLLDLQDADSKERIVQYLERNPGLSLVAKISQSVVGVILCGHDGRRGILYHLAVAENYRQKGFGSRLVEKSLSLLRQQGITVCLSYVLGNSADTIRFWEKCGWQKAEGIDIYFRK